MHKEEASQLFKVLGDASRVKIIKMLYHRGEICACKLLDIVECEQPTLSHHLSVLTKADFVIPRKEGKWVHYRCNKERVDALMRFISSPCGCCKGEAE